MSDATRILDHLETFDLGDDPVTTVLTVLRRVMGKLWGYKVESRVRRDGIYTCFSLADGSIVAVNCTLKEKSDSRGEPWPWLICASDRAEIDLHIHGQFAPTWVDDCLRMGSVADMQQSVAA